MLGAGALPLDILEARMDAWLAAQLASHDVTKNPSALPCAVTAPRGAAFLSD